jgi:hypothetical protein
MQLTSELSLAFNPRQGLSNLLFGMGVDCLAVQIQTPYWSLSGNASSTDFEARPRDCACGE